MSDLEESGLLGHPHTSAGRIPTDLGYRYYVNSLMDSPQLPKSDVDFIESQLEQLNFDTNEILKVTSSILSSLTNQLAYVSYPKFGNAILERLRLVEVSSSRILVVITINSGMIRTITLEINSGFDRKSLKTIERLLNERLSGLTFSEIRETVTERIKNISSSEFKPVIRVF